MCCYEKNCELCAFRASSVVQPTNGSGKWSGLNTHEWTERPAKVKLNIWTNLWLNWIGFEFRIGLKSDAVPFIVERRKRNRPRPEWKTSKADSDIQEAYRKRWAEIIIEFNELSTCQNLICIDCFQHWTRRTIYEYLFDFEHCACKNVSVQNELQEWLQIEFIGHSLKLFVCWMASLYVDNMIFQCNIHFYSTQFDDTAMPKYVCVYHSRMGRECYFVAHKLHRKTLRMSAKTIRRLQQYQKCAT